MSRLMSAMLLGGARAAGAAALTGTTAVKPLPKHYLLAPRPHTASWSPLCLQTAPKSSQVTSNVHATGLYYRVYGEMHAHSAVSCSALP
jgi:hypothetical protein